MKRIHIHLTVPDIEPAIGFYTVLFGAQPSMVKEDYAKWTLDDPRVNLAISTRAPTPGIDHVGIQVDSADELAEIATRLRTAGEDIFDQAATTCCYAKSDKSWVSDPAGMRWETFFSHGDATSYGEDMPAASGSCCGTPQATEQACC